MHSLNWVETVETALLLSSLVATFVVCWLPLQNVGPDLAPNCLTLWYYCWKIFFWKVTEDKKSCKITQHVKSVKYFLGMPRRPHSSWHIYVHEKYYPSYLELCILWSLTCTGFLRIIRAGDKVLFFFFFSKKPKYVDNVDNFLISLLWWFGVLLDISTLFNPCPAEPGYGLTLQIVKIQISWLLQKPTDVDLHCLSFGIRICINNLDQVNWLAEN